MDIFMFIKSSLLYLVFICKVTFTEKISADFERQKSDSLNKCQRCKLLIDSFSYWIEKTSRGKYEGGDTAWEEAKLKSYARSEIRLVEIQEGLCTEVKRHQDHCYSLAEEAEQPLEQWWFHEDPNSVDLYMWLCIQTLQHCCPQNHYGESCAPCLLDKNNVICGGHGKCDGEGTRKGNGSCVCNTGYVGRYCNECSKNYYSTNESTCEQCHRACDGCSGKGAYACIACNSGWQNESGICIDINECSDTSVCKTNQFCVNKEGSYMCKLCDISCQTCMGMGPTNCTSCEMNSTLWNGVCLNDTLKNDFLTSALKRAALYCGLLIIASFIFRSSNTLASLIVLVIAVYIYFSEKTFKLNILDITFNILREYNIL